MTAPVSVVISTFEEGASLAATVSSVLAADDAPHEVIIVDDGSTDGSCDGDWPAEVRVIRQHHTGIAAARNRGVRAATQPNLVFLDAHCTVADRWLRPLLGALDQAPLALAGPAVRDADDQRYLGCGAQLVDPRLTYRWCRAPADSAVFEVGLIPGGCLAVRRSAFAGAGGFAAFRGFGLEDVELGLRWWRMGNPMLGVPESVVTHRFRTTAPYRPDHQAWLENILRTALLHLSGNQLRACLTACTRFDSFPAAITTVLSEDWLTTHQHLAQTGSRTVLDYLDRWAPQAFPC